MPAGEGDRFWALGDCGSDLEIFLFFKGDNSGSFVVTIQHIVPA